MNLKQYQESKSPSAGVADNSQVIALLAQAALSHVAELARMGRYDDADRALGVTPGIASAPALDLLARIRAQQGRVMEAQTLWSESLLLDPNNVSYRAALQRLARLNRHSWGLDIWRSFAGVALTVLVFAILALMVRMWWRQERLNLVTAVKTALQPAQASRLPELRIQIHGVSQRVEGDRIILRFDSGLFQRADILTPQGQSVLEELGRQLQPTADQLSLCVMGHSDDIPITRRVRFGDNRFLALARAQVAAEILSTSSGIPEQQITLQSAEEALYPNDSPEDRAKNRSVEIWARQGQVR